MKFKARITNPASIITLQQVCAGFARASRARQCMLRLTPAKLFLTPLADSAALTVWAEMEQVNLFEWYRIESQHENNEILMELHLDFLLKALRSATDASDMTLKLTKRDGITYLSSSFGTVSSSTGSSRPVVQELPVLIHPAENIAAVQPPALPKPDVPIYLPDIKIFRGVVDRLKSLSPTLTLAANYQGELTLELASHVVSVRTCFRHLENPMWLDGTAADVTTQQMAAGNFVSVTVDARLLANFLSGCTQVQAIRHLLLSLRENNSAALILLHNDATVTMSLPLWSPDGE